MERRDFLAQLGIGAAFALTTSCFMACSKTAAPVDFTLDLTSASNAALQTNGKYIVTNNTVVARTNTGAYVAATLICSHENNPNIYYDPGNNDFQCTVHGARFDLAGKGLNADGSNGLTIYKTTLTGTSLRVYS